MLIAIAALLFLVIGMGVALAIAPMADGRPARAKKTKPIKRLRGVTSVSTLVVQLRERGWLEAPSPNASTPNERVFTRGKLTVSIRDEQPVVAELQLPLAGELPEHFQITANPNTTKLRVALKRGLESWDVSSVEAFALLGVEPHHLLELRWRRLNITGERLTLMSERSDGFDAEELERLAELVQRIALTCKNIEASSTRQLASRRLEHPQAKAAWTLCLRILLAGVDDVLEPSLGRWINAHYQDIQLSALFGAHGELLLEALPLEAILKLNLPHSPKLARTLFERAQPEQLLADPKLNEGMRLELCRLALRRLSPDQANAAVAAALSATSQGALSDLIARLLPSVEDGALWLNAPCGEALRSRLRELRAPQHEQVFKSFSDQLATPFILAHYAALLREHHAQGGVPDAALMTLLSWTGWRPDEVTLRAIAKRLRTAHDRGAISLYEVWALWLERTDWSVDAFELIKITVNAHRQRLSSQDRGVLRQELTTLLTRKRLAQSQLQSAELIDLLILAMHSDDATQPQAKLIDAALARFEAAAPHVQLVRWSSQVMAKSTRAQEGRIRAAQQRWIDELGLHYAPGAMMLATHQGPEGALTQSKGSLRGALTAEQAGDDINQ